MQVIETSPKTDIPSSRVIDSSDELAEKVREKTLEALSVTGVLRDTESEGFDKYLVSNSINAGEILPVMAQLRGIAEVEQSAAVGNWGRGMAPIIKKRYSLVSFADRLLGSTSIFEKYELLRKASEAVKSPMIFSEDTDVIGFGTLNPVAGALLSEFVSEYLSEQIGTRPYISIFLLDLTSWEKICRKQFEQ